MRWELYVRRSMVLLHCTDKTWGAGMAFPWKTLVAAIPTPT